MAFFHTLYAGLQQNTETIFTDKVKATLPKLGARLLQAGGQVGGAVAEAAGSSIAGSAIQRGTEWLAGLIAQEDTVESLHAELSEALRKQNKRFLMVIDDIDRLSPDEALLVFRLIKSVGRLPNVIYLLAYDRQLAEKIVSERYPSEGPHYLDKIVQATFEIPYPSQSTLEEEYLWPQIQHICGEYAKFNQREEWLSLREALMHVMHTPRDAIRFTNSLRITWPAVEGEVDFADFLMLEILRLWYPQVHRAIQQHKWQLLDKSLRAKQGIGTYFNQIFFGTTLNNESVQKILKKCPCSD